MAERGSRGRRRWPAAWLGWCRQAGWLRGQRLLGYVVLGVLLLTVLALARQDAHDRAAARASQQRTACQTRYNLAFAANLHERSLLSDQDRDANSRLQEQTARLFITVFTLPATDPPAERTRLAVEAFTRYRKAYGTYQAAEARIDQQRLDHPLPAVPAGACT
jgi:hypothetical protein